MESRFTERLEEPHSMETISMAPIYIYQQASAEAIT